MEKTPKTTKKQEKEVKKPVVKKAPVKAKAEKPAEDKTLSQVKKDEKVLNAPASEASNELDFETPEEREAIENFEIKTSQKYFESVGRRKTSTSRVRLYTQGEKGITINNKPYTEYFPTSFLQKIVQDPMDKLKCLGKFGVTVKVKGGGPTGQAEAVRHGISRALVALNPYFKKRLKKAGYLTRDPRMRERKKPGLRRARRAPQWSKR